MKEYFYLGMFFEIFFKKQRSACATSTVQCTVYSVGTHILHVLLVLYSVGTHILHVLLVLYSVQCTV